MQTQVTLFFVFVCSTFSEQSDRWLVPLNDWIKGHFEVVTDYFNDLIDVVEPSEYLQVDRYMELTQKAKSVIIISLQEISLTHRNVLSNLDKLTKVKISVFCLLFIHFSKRFVVQQDKEDPLRVILNDLGDPIEISKDDDREIQLTLTNRFTQNMDGQ